MPVFPASKIEVLEQLRELVAEGHFGLVFSVLRASSARSGLGWEEAYARTWTAGRGIDRSPSNLP